MKTQTVTQHESESRLYRRILIVVLGLSFLARFFLILSGGQFYWPDESRYESSRAAAGALWAGNVQESMRALRSVEHLFYKALGVLPASMEMAWGPSPKIPALFFSLFSVASLWLVWAILRRLGESERAAILAVGLLALCSTFLYYCRHLLPYDTAMALGLLSLFCGLRTPARARDSILCGFFALLAFLTYNGYWTLVVFALLAHLAQPPRELRCQIRKVGLAGFSFFIPLIGIWVAVALAGGNLIRQFILFADTIKQGNFSEGWSLPFEYLWAAEHGLLFLWALAVIFSAVALIRGRGGKGLGLGLSGVAFVYGTLVLFSTVLERFVVYGRLARQLVPFLCILAALACDRLWASGHRGKQIAMGLLLASLIQGIANFHRPFAQAFPEDFRRLAAHKAMESGMGPYVLTFDGHIAREIPTTDYEGEVVLERLHPLQFQPYQYEGYPREMRNRLRSTDIRMKLIVKTNPQDL